MNSQMLSAVLALVAVFIIITVVNVVVKQFGQSYTTETALLVSGTDSEFVKGVFIRDETVITYDGGGVLDYQVPDGGKLGIGSVIADVYASESQITAGQKIEQLQNELYLLKRISNPGTTQTAQPSNIEALFTENFVDYLYQREQNDLGNLQESREEMSVLLGIYQLITGNDTSYQERMNSIQGEIVALQQSQEAPVSVITSDRASYFVSYADGYEDTLRLSDVNLLTPDQIEQVENTTLRDQNIVGKLIDSYQWVLAVVVDNTERKYRDGDRLILKFASTSGTVTGFITSVNSRAGDDKTVLGITCETLTYDFVQHRTESVELIRTKSTGALQGEYQGIRVPRSALHFRSITEEVKDEETGAVRQVTTRYRGVYVLDGEQPEFRKLDVIYEGDDYVISAERPDRAYLALYDSIITGGLDADGE